jgi:hypothetical protein
MDERRGHDDQRVLVDQFRDSLEIQDAVGGSRQAAGQSVMTARDGVRPDSRNIREPFGGFLPNGGGTGFRRWIEIGMGLLLRT